jgi:hypothetical protein
VEVKEKKNVVIMSCNIVPHMLHTSTKYKQMTKKIGRWKREQFLSEALNLQ